MTVNHDVVGSSPTAWVIFKEDKFSYLFLFLLYNFINREDIKKGLKVILSWPQKFDFFLSNFWGAVQYIFFSFQKKGYLLQGHDSFSEQQDSKQGGQREGKMLD